MKRAWMPGEVALIEAGCSANRQVALRTGTPSNMGWAYSGTHNGESTQSWTADTHGTVSVVRPLVVIDPEDREQVERLALEIYSRTTGEESFGGQIANVQAALHEFTSPNVEEPTGLGAVVEDEVGNVWVRIGADEDPRDDHLRTQMSPPWRARGKSAKWWASLRVARVLSEGVAVDG